MLQHRPLMEHPAQSILEHAEVPRHLAGDLVTLLQRCPAYSQGGA